VGGGVEKEKLIWDVFFFYFMKIMKKRRGGGEGGERGGYEKGGGGGAENRNACKVLSGIMKERGRLEDLSVDEIMALKYISRKLNSSVSLQGPVARS